MKSNPDKVAQLREKKSRILQMGGAARVEAQHKVNKLTARERIARLKEREAYAEPATLKQLVLSKYGKKGLQALDMMREEGRL